MHALRILFHAPQGIGPFPPPVPIAAASRDAGRPGAIVGGATVLRAALVPA